MHAMQVHLVYGWQQPQLHFFFDRAAAQLTLYKELSEFYRT